MSTINRKKFKIGLLFSSFSFCVANLPCQADPVEIGEENLFVPHRIASKASMVYDSHTNEFTALLDGKAKKINKHDVSGLPENLSEIQLKEFLKVGYFSLNTVGDDLSLNAKLRLLGGGKGKQRTTRAQKEVNELERANARMIVGRTVIGTGVGLLTGGPLNAVRGGAMGFASGIASSTQRVDAPQTQEYKQPISGHF